MVRAGLGVGMDGHGAGPELLRAHPGEVDRCLAVHAGGLRGVGVELVAGDDPDAVKLPRWRRLAMLVRLPGRVVVGTHDNRLAPGCSAVIHGL